MHAVIESQRGQLGKLFLKEAAPNTGIPGEIAGYSTERFEVPANGILARKKILVMLLKKVRLAKAVINL